MMVKKRVILIFGLFLIFGMTSFISASLPPPSGSYCASSGYHGVEIGGNCFDCGTTDGICPIDFGVSELNCVGDYDCIGTSTSNGFWSLNGANEISTYTESSPLLISLTDGLKLYLIISNAGIPGSTMDVEIYEQDSGLLGIDDYLGTVRTVVNSQGNAVGNWTIDSIGDLNEKETNEDPKTENKEGETLGLFFSWAGETKTSKTLYANTTLESGTPTSGCEDYTSLGQSACEEDEDGAANDTLLSTYTSLRFVDPQGSVCWYTHLANCSWYADLGCKFTTGGEVADNTNADTCRGASTNTCVYNEGAKEGDCTVDDFFKVSYSPATGFNETQCPSWQSGAIPCPKKLRVPFFGAFGFIAIILLISLIYLVLNKRKEN